MRGESYLNLILSGNVPQSDIDLSGLMSSGNVPHSNIDQYGLNVKR